MASHLVGDLLVADDDFGGLHALGVDRVPKNLARADPGDFNQLANRNVVGLHEELVYAADGIALIDFEIDLAALREERGRIGRAVDRARKGFGGWVPGVSQLLITEVGKREAIGGI